MKRFNSRYYKTLYQLFLAIPILLTISLVFYIVTFATERSYKVKEYNQQLAEWKEVGGAQNIGMIRMRAKLMPSQNTEGNMLPMEWRNSSTGYESDKQMRKGYEKSYHYMDNTRDTFPTFYYKEEFVPLGDSKTICIHVLWAPADKENVLDIYKSVEGLPTCLNAINERYRWQSHDPTTGIDVKAWTQIEQPMTCSSVASCSKQCSSQGGYYVHYDSENICYKYLIASHVCLKVTMRENTNTGDLAVVYEGGCFANSSAVQYVPATPDTIYAFDKMPIEVRSSKDPYTIASENDFDFGMDLSLFGYLSFIFFFFAMTFLVVFGFAYFLLWKGAQDNGIPPHVEQHDENDNAGIKASI